MNSLHHSNLKYGDNGFSITDLKPNRLTVHPQEGFSNILGQSSVSAEKCVRKCVGLSYYHPRYKNRQYQSPLSPHTYTPPVYVSFLSLLSLSLTVLHY